jgi:hypothetical protein
LSQNQRPCAPPSLFSKEDCKDTPLFVSCKFSEVFYFNFVPCAPCSKNSLSENLPLCFQSECKDKT